MRSIERSQADIVGEIQEKQRAVEKQADWLIKELEQEVADLESGNNKHGELCSTPQQVGVLLLLSVVDLNVVDYRVRVRVRVETGYGHEARVMVRVEATVRIRFSVKTGCAHEARVRINSGQFLVNLNSADSIQYSQKRTTPLSQVSLSSALVWVTVKHFVTMFL